VAAENASVTAEEVQISVTNARKSAEFSEETAKRAVQRMQDEAEEKLPFFVHLADRVHRREARPAPRARKSWKSFLPGGHAPRRAGGLTSAARGGGGAGGGQAHGADGPDADAADLSCDARPAQGPRDARQQVRAAPPARSSSAAAARIDGHAGGASRGARRKDVVWIAQAAQHHALGTAHAQEAEELMSPQVVAWVQRMRRRARKDAAWHVRRPDVGPRPPHPAPAPAPAARPRRRRPGAARVTARARLQAPREEEAAEEPEGAGGALSRMPSNKSALHGFTSIAVRRPSAFTRPRPRRAPQRLTAHGGPRCSRTPARQRASAAASRRA